MKRILKGLIFGFAGVLAISLASCGKPTPTPTPTPTPEPTVDPVTPTPVHTHSLVDGWKRDSASHWHECSTCDEIVDLANHKYGDWVVTEGECTKKAECSVCGFVKTENIDHDWDEWKEQEDGTMAKTCKHCGRVESVVQYYVRGTLNEWGVSDDYKLEVNYENMTSSITVSLTAGDNFKVADANWSDNANFGFDNIEFKEGLFERKSESSDDIVVLVTADYKITVSGLAGSEHKVTIEQLCVHDFVWTEVADKACNFTGVCKNCQATGSKVEHTWGEDIICDKCNAVDVLDYYIKGSFLETTWGPAEANKFTLAGDNKSSSYVINVKAGDEFKIGSKEGWEFDASNVTFNVPHFEGTGNIIVKADGVYVVIVSGLDTTTHTVSINPVQLYVRGDMNGWGTADALDYDEATDTASREVTVAEGQTFKVAPENWGLLNNAYNFGKGEEGYVTNGDNIVLEAGVYIVTVTGVCHGTPALTIVAKPDGYSVNYVTEQGEAPVAVENVKALPAELPVLTADGYEFLGWFADEALTVKAVAGAEITANTVLYAKWREIVPVGDVYVDGQKLVINKYYDYATQKNIDELAVTVYLNVDEVVSVSDKDNTFGYGFEEINFVEGLFVDSEGSLKVTKEGYYKFSILDYSDREIATCSAVLSHEAMTLAQVLESAVGTNYFSKGTVVSEDADSIVLTDGLDPASTITVKLLGNFLPGDVVSFTGSKTEKNSKVSYSATLVDRISTVAVEIDNHLNKVTSLDQINDGAKVVIANGNYVMGAQNGTYREVIYSPNYKDNRAQVVTLVKNGDNWKLQLSAEEYLLYPDNAKNQITTGAYAAEKGDWTIAINDGVLKITSVADEQYCIQFNYSASQMRFAGYKSTQADIDLYVIQSAVENYSVSELVHGTDYKKQTLFDGEAVKIDTLSGTIKADANEEIHEGAMQLKLDKDIDGETIKNKGLLFTAKEDCTLVLTVCASGSNKGWVVTSNDVEVASGSVDKNGGAISIITLNVKAGESYRFSSPAGGIRFESVTVYKNI